MTIFDRLLLLLLGFAHLLVLLSARLFALHLMPVSLNIRKPGRLLCLWLFFRKVRILERRPCRWAFCRVKSEQGLCKVKSCRCFDVLAARRWVVSQERQINEARLTGRRQL